MGSAGATKRLGGQQDLPPRLTALTGLGWGARLRTVASARLGFRPPLPSCAAFRSSHFVTDMPQVQRYDLRDGRTISMFPGVKTLRLRRPLPAIRRAARRIQEPVSWAGRHATARAHRRTSGTL